MFERHGTSFRAQKTSNTDFSKARRTDSLCLNDMWSCLSGAKKWAANFDIQSKRWRPGERGGRSALAP